MADLENHSINKVLARKGAKTCLRKAGAKNSPWRTSPPLWIPKNPPRRTSLRVFSVIICVKIIPCAAAYGCDHNPTAIDTSPILYRRLRGSDYHYRSIPPVLPGVIDIQILRICHPNPQENKKRETNFPFLSMF